MKSLLAIFLLVQGLIAQDQIDLIQKKYREREIRGVSTLHRQQIEELDELKKRALRAEKLNLALKADEAIKALQKKLASLPVVQPLKNTPSQKSIFPKTKT